MKEAHILTTKLLTYLIDLNEQFEREPVKVKDRAFFNHVKLSVDPIFDILEKWEETVTPLIHTKELSTTLQQVDATVDNMRTLILHSFYHDVRRRRYMEIYKSIHFVLLKVEKESKEDAT